MLRETTDEGAGNDDDDGLVGAVNGAEGCIEHFDQLAQDFTTAGNPVERSNVLEDTQRQVEAAKDDGDDEYKRALYV